MRRALLWAVDHPVLTTAVIIVVTVFLASRIPHLRVDVSAEGGMAEHDPARAYYDEFKRVYGRGSQTSVLVVAPDVFAAPVLQAIDRLTVALGRLDGVTRVESLTTVNHVRGEGDRIETGPLVGDPIPSDPAVLAAIRSQALGSRILAGTLVAGDGRATVIVVDTSPAGGDAAFNRRFSAEVESLIARDTAPGMTVQQIGSPFVRAVLVRYIWEDQRLLAPLAAVLVVTVLLLALRTTQGVLIPSVNEGLSVVWALGLMALFDLPVTSMTLAIPSLLIAIGFSEDVHMLTRYHRLLEGGLDRAAAIRAMVGHTAVPVLITTATTVVGFASLATADITILRQFGYAASLAFTADFVVTVLFLPVLLRVLPVPRRLRGTAAPTRADVLLVGAVDRLGRWSLEHRRVVTVGAGLVLGGAVVGWLVLDVNNDFIQGALRPSSVIRRRMVELRDTLRGAQSFSIVVDTGRPDGMKDPAVLRRVAALQEFLEGSPGVARTTSITDYLRTIHREMHGGDPARETVPETPEQVAQYLLMLEGRELGDLIDFSAATAQVVVRHDHSGSRELSALLRRLDEYLPEHFPPPLRVRYTGDEVLLTSANDYMVTNEIQGLGYSFVLIALIHAWLFRSLRAGLLSLIPNAIPALSVFGLMGLLGVPLDVGTASIASVAIGIAVDDTVHFFEEYRERRHHADTREAILQALSAQARPIVFVSVVLALGFSILALSNFKTLANFGLFSAFVMLIAMIAELMLSPVVMSVMAPPPGRGAAAIEAG